jgi:hypothetical protein
MSTMLREDLQKRFDDIEKLLEKELQWHPFPGCSGFSVTPHGVCDALDRLSRLKKDVLKGLKQMEFNFEDDKDEEA